MDFSVILQSPQVRQIVQENLLERAFHDALYPRLLFRGEAMPQPWAAGIGDSQIFSAPGLMRPTARPLLPGQDPVPAGYSIEQWFATMNQYAGTTDTHMPTDMVAIASLFLRNAHQLGLQGAMSINRLVRDRLYNAALSGWTVCDGAQNNVTIRVKRLNGLTRARNANLSGASQVRFEPVSPTNPLTCYVYDLTGPAEVTRTIVGYTPDTPGDEIGPGTVTLNSAVNVADRAYFVTIDRSFVQRVGGGMSVNSIGSTDLPTLEDVRDGISNFWQQNVPEHSDGRFHAHVSPVSQAKLFKDAEFQRLNTSLPDYFIYRQFALGEMLGTVFFRNSECPTQDTVDLGLTNGAIPFSQEDPFAGELTNNGLSTGVPVNRILFTAQSAVFEYYADLAALITEAGINGKIAEPRISNNGIDVVSERIQLIIRSPQNRLQDMVSTTWKFMGDWPMRTDAATGSRARYKRTLCIEHGS